jgi:hypothetical protein
VAAKQNRRIGRDVGLDEVGRVELAEDLNDFRLRRGIVFELPAHEVPRFANGTRAVEQTNEAIRCVGQTMELVAGRIAHHVPAVAAVVLPADLCPGAELRAQVFDAVPGLGECGTKLKHQC